MEEGGEGEMFAHDVEGGIQRRHDSQEEHVEPVADKTRRYECRGRE
jgi:hypothetical protein